jgi:hypothetical protein
MIYADGSGEDKMIPAYAERELLFKAFARALFAADMAELYQAVTPDFLWSYHDGVAVTKSLASAAAIAAHLAEQKALLQVQGRQDRDQGRLSQADRGLTAARR